MCAPKRGTLLLLLGLVLGTAARASAQDSNHLYDTFQLNVSAAGVILGTTLRVDGDTDAGTVGTEISTEDDLGLNRAGIRPRIGFRWRPGRRHELEASYLFINRSGSRAIEEDITIDSVTYTAGAQLDTRIGSNQLGVAYRWAFHAADRTQAGLSVGLGATFFRTRFEGEGTVTGGGDSTSGDFTYERNAVGPSLALGFFGRWRFADDWYLEGDVRGLYVPIDNLTATVLEVGGAVRWFPIAQLGFEAGYGLLQQRIELEQGDDPLVDVGFTGRLRYLTQNLRLGAIWAF
ncbi:MAG: hypothetical protein MUC69_01345 [Gemmatimonadales bacterium]|jgi:hypothetical protein|nr:hypothetical protein [Gemmatimonadales bacterium]